VKGLALKRLGELYTKAGKLKKNNIPSIQDFEGKPPKEFKKTRRWSREKTEEKTEERTENRTEQKMEQKPEEKLPSYKGPWTEEALSSLSIKELKTIMRERFLDSSSCIEKGELISSILISVK